MIGRQETQNWLNPHTTFKSVFEPFRGFFGHVYFPGPPDNRPKNSGPLLRGQKGGPPKNLRFPQDVNSGRFHRVPKVEKMQFPKPKVSIEP